MILFIYSTGIYYHLEKDIYNELAYYALEVLFYCSAIFFIIKIIKKMIASIENKIFFAAVFMVIAIYLEMKYNFISLEDEKETSLLDENTGSITEFISNIDSWDLFVFGGRLNVNITIYCIICLILIHLIEKKKFSLDSIRPRFIRSLVERIYTRYQNNKQILYIFMLVNKLMLLFSLIMVLPLLIN